MFKSEINWEKEIPSIKEMGGQGMRMPAIAKKYGVTRQRIKQVLLKYIPEWTEKYGAIVWRKQVAQEWTDKWGDKNNSDIYKAQREKFNRKKANALKKGNTWEIKFGDLVWPTHCPILGLELDYFAETRQENSPSFDQIDAGKGYVRGNVQILSWRANRIKNDGTAREHRLIADYLDLTHS